MLLASNTNIVDNTNQYLKTNTIGDKRFELSNHLGNFNDTWVLIDKTFSGLNPNKAQEVKGIFSGKMLGRYGLDHEIAYRYDFQGEKMDDEVKGNGNSVNYKYRMHDPMAGRFFAVDPMTSSFPQCQGGTNISDQYKSDLNEILNIFLSSEGVSLEIRSGNLNTLQNGTD